MKEDKYLFITVSINSLVAFPYVFGNVVKILTGIKFYISLFLEVPSSSGETTAISALPGKRPFEKLLFIAFYKFRRNNMHSEV